MPPIPPNPNVPLWLKGLRLAQSKMARLGGGATAPKVEEPRPASAEEWAATGRWAQVVSSDVQAIRYEAGHRHLHVIFRRGHREYLYPEVDPGLAKSMYHAASMGRFVHRYLKGRAFQKVSS